MTNCNSKAAIDHLTALYNSGNLHGAYETAKSATIDFPNEITILTIMGAAAAQTGRLDQAMRAFEQILLIQPQNFITHNNLGNVYKMLERLPEACSAYKKAIKIEPNYSDAHNNLGISQQALGQTQDAIDSFKKAIALKGKNYEAYHNLSISLRSIGLLEEALIASQTSIKLNPNNPFYHVSIGNIYKELAQYKRAISAYKRASQLKSDYALPFQNLAVLYLELGNRTDAIAALERGLRIDPQNFSCIRLLSVLKKWTKNDPQLSFVENMLRNERLKDHNKCELHFALAKMQEDIGDFEASFTNYTVGGKLRQKALSYDLDADINLFRGIKEASFETKRASIKKTNSILHHIPIFIVGMPRSGTTLIEQIISSHSDVEGGGELKFLGSISQRLGGDQNSFSTRALENLRKEYSNKINKLAKGKNFITDKMPQNFLRIGLIFGAFPEAKVVHVKRDPAATCWSNFKHYFADEGLGYSYDINDTVHYFKLYDELMKHWKNLYGKKIFHVDYEKLTSESKPEIQSLLLYLGLNWEDNCLSPERNKRSVRTASSQQVRKKIYSGSSKSWKKFEPFLGDVFSILY